jgi:hypothetical protein
VLLDELANLLIAQGVGVLPGSTNVTAWTIHKGFQPPALSASTPGSITLYETGALDDQPNAADDLPERPTFQVRLRGTPLAYSAARTKCDAVRNAFYTVGNENLSGRYFAHVTMPTAPIGLGVDANQRPEFTLNGVAIRSRT